MKENTKALALIQSAKTNQTWAMLLGTAGGALVGFSIGTAIGGGNPEWAVDLYNEGITSTSYQFQPTFNLNINDTNLGISMNF
ncbi:hypothetical protein [Polaribacter sp.]|uniref:hypothetical protein n=1 Tax=Polaribacter sp. TaxID=1920175 RepID=UPI0025FF8602|nr:hypothetical protein [Polaribacter sp.]